MENLKRCPNCNLVPKVTVDSLDQVTMICEKHGHIALGNNLEQATEFWNIYVTFIAKAA